MEPVGMTIDALFEAHEAALQWQWVVGQSLAKNKVLDPVVVERASSSSDLVGYLNFLHPYRIQVLGEEEINYFNSIDDRERARLFDETILSKAPLLVVAGGHVAPDALVYRCVAANVPVLATKISAASVINILLSWIAKRFAPHVNIHGVFMDIFGVGVLIIGDSGLGKSELGLELVSRGHRLVADDVVDFYQVAHGVLMGHCSPLLQNLMEVRGIGLLDVRTIFGEMAVRPKMQLALIVHLIRREVFDTDFERLPTQLLEQEILGVKIRKAMIPVEAGRNIAVLAEAAVRNTILQMRGIDTMADFVNRHRLAMGLGSDEDVGEQ